MKNREEEGVPGAERGELSAGPVLALALLAVSESELLEMRPERFKELRRVQVRIFDGACACQIDRGRARSDDGCGTKRHQPGGCSSRSLVLCEVFL